MQYQPAIKLKAIFLLATFSLNLVVGTACSLGIDMGFNSHHHHNEEVQENNAYTIGQNHSHVHSFSNQKHEYPHKDLPGINRSKTPVLSAASDDNCCNHFVVGFQSLDKQIVEKMALQQLPIYPAAVVFNSIISLSNPFYSKPVRLPSIFFDIPPPDIRVIIQSFLI